MTKKLLNNRYFAICVCALFAVAFMLAMKYDQRGKVSQSNRRRVEKVNPTAPASDGRSLLVEPIPELDFGVYTAQREDSILMLDEPGSEAEDSPSEIPMLPSIQDPELLEQSDSSMEWEGQLGQPVQLEVPELNGPPSFVGNAVGELGSSSVQADNSFERRIEANRQQRKSEQADRVANRMIDDQSDGTSEVVRRPDGWRQNHFANQNSNTEVEAGQSQNFISEQGVSKQLTQNSQESAQSIQVDTQNSPGADLTPPADRTTVPALLASSPNSSTANPNSATGNSGPKANPAKQDSNSLNPSNFRLAEQPKAGETFHPHRPQTDARTWLVDADVNDFHPGPVYDGLPYDPYRQMDVYQGKTLNAVQRPLLELGRPWYQLGQLSEGYDFLGRHNLVTPQLIVFGDFRTAAASNHNVNDSRNQVAFEWNMNWDFRLTSTERFAWFLTPLNDGENNTRFELDNDQYVDEWNADFQFGYFEGDLGAIVGGMTGQTLPFDFPFAVGVMPLLFQNGVWLEDQFLGVAATIPAKNSPQLDISNMDVTFFAGYDEILSPAFDNEDDVARLYGIASFIEANNGYWEIDYAYLEDRNQVRDRSYHNIGIGFTRRYGRWISNSTRMIVNAGQSTAGGPNTADGVLLLSENSLITANPSSIVPYFNFFAGFDRPQKAAGNNILRNTGILFESDGMTGYPTLDDTAQNTYGGAIGVNMMPRDFSQQLILETAFLGVMGDQSDRNAAGDQFGVGMRYQLPLNNSVILRTDAMYGFLRNSDDINGVRLELRRKF